MSPEKEDIKFLKAYLKELQKTHQILSELCYPQEFVISDSNEMPVTSKEGERVARLADTNGFDGSLFRYLIPEPSDDPTSLESMRHLRKQIETIPRIIAKIEECDKTGQGWLIENGQVFYDGTDLEFPSGQIQEVLRRLTDLEGKTVSCKDINQIMSEDQYRHYIEDIRKHLKDKNVPYEIKTVTYEGYKLQKKQGS